MKFVVCPTVVGRSAEIGELNAALDQANAGHGGVTFLTGPGGLGKSRLLGELSDRARATGFDVCSGRSPSPASSIPYRALAEALQSLIRERNLGRDPELELWLGILADVVPGLGPAAESSAAGHAEAVLRLLQRCAQHQPLLVVLDDMQWADPDSAATLTFLADNLTSSRVLCVVAVRDEPASECLAVAQRLRDRRAAVITTLGPLSEGAVEEMVRACVDDPEPDLITRIQRTADGNPFLVEELLVTPGVPSSFGESVRERMSLLDEVSRDVVEAAAVLGKRFDWRLLAAITGYDEPTVAAALDHAHQVALLVVQGDDFEFRHTLTREALVAALLPPRRARLAAAALSALTELRPHDEPTWRDTAADLAETAGDRSRAAALLVESGRDSMQRGALATAAQSLTRAADAANDPVLRTTARSLLVETLSLAGRIDEALALGTAVVGQSNPSCPVPVAIKLHLLLANACGKAHRLPLARIQLELARQLLATTTAQDDEFAVARARANIVDAELALADDESAEVRTAAKEAIRLAHGLAFDVECNAWELIGRSLRLRDQGEARRAFESEIAAADRAQLPLWRLRALQELGTMDLLDHGGDERLLQAVAVAAPLGAMDTAAYLELHLAAVYDQRFDVARLLRHSTRARLGAQRLRLTALIGVASWFESHAYAILGDETAMNDRIQAALAAGPDNPYLPGWIAMGAHGVVALLAEDHHEAVRAMAHGAAILDSLPPTASAQMRGIWPLLALVRRDDRAEIAYQRAQQPDVTVNRLNRGLLGYAAAVRAGRGGAIDAAQQFVDTAEADLAPFRVWGSLGRRLLAQAALDDGWGQPQRWFATAAASLDDPAMAVVAARCEHLAQLGTVADPLDGVTGRQREVLDLLTRGMSNKDIASALTISPRTVEKHVEALLRKSNAKSRSALVALNLGALSSAQPMTNSR